MGLFSRNPADDPEYKSAVKRAEQAEATYRTAPHGADHARNWRRVEIARVGVEHAEGDAWRRAKGWRR